jgi:DNA-binding transcriptional LysR family regulator
MNEMSSSFTRRRLPLGALRAFEAAARLESFRLAAEELAVTPTAISHRIRALEETLGLKLFDRQVRRVSLTVAGKRLFPVLRDGFDAFAEALRGLKPDDGETVVTLSALVGFTARLLLPRMAEFRRAHPKVQLRLHASDDPVDLRSGAADLAIRYGYGPFPGLVSEPLFVETFAPVCSPKLALVAPDDVRGQACCIASGGIRRPTRQPGRVGRRPRASPTSTPPRAWPSPTTATPTRRRSAGWAWPWAVSAWCATSWTQVCWSSRSDR